MLGCAITDRSLLGRLTLPELARQWAVEGVTYIQLREKDLSASAHADLARALLAEIADAASPTRLLINSRADVAIAVQAHGVHLTASPHELPPAAVRALYAEVGLPAPTISASCHSLDEVARARDAGATLLLFGPVFEKVIPGRAPLPGLGLDALHAACEAAADIPVLALGGITHNNARYCIQVGASGIAAIRLFLDR